MKKLKTFTITTIITSSLISTSAFAGDTIFGAWGDAALKAKNLFRSTIETEATSLETDGSNARLYVYDAPGNKYYTCHFVAASQKGGVSCYPKEIVTESLLKNNK